MVTIAAASGIALTEVSSSVEADIDLRGALGVDDIVRAGFQRVRIDFVVRGSAAGTGIVEVTVTTAVGAPRPLTSGTGTGSGRA